MHGNRRKTGPSDSARIIGRSGGELEALVTKSSSNRCCQEQVICLGPASAEARSDCSTGRNGNFTTCLFARQGGTAESRRGILLVGARRLS